jgi:hypothetical protein
MATGQDATEQRIAALERQIARLTERLDGIHLDFGAEVAGAEYACGQTSKAGEQSSFMMGLRDGTGCGVPSVNFYRSLQLIVPGR